MTKHVVRLFLISDKVTFFLQVLFEVVPADKKDM